MQSSIYGRMTQEPREIQTKIGTTMTALNIAVDVTPNNQADRETVFFNVTGFGRVAEAMLKQRKGENIAAMGKVTLSHWTNKEGEIKDNWNLTADSIISAKTSNPNQGNGKQSNQPPPHSEAPSAQADFDDDIPF